MKATQRTVMSWLIVGLVGFLLLPWYALQDSLWSLHWLVGVYSNDQMAAGIAQATAYGRPWLWGCAAALAFCGAAPYLFRTRETLGRALLIAGGGGVLFGLLQAFAIGPGGWSFATLQATLPALSSGQYGIGAGGMLVGVALLMLFAFGLALCGFFRGDAFVAGSVVGVTALVLLFTFFPVAKILATAVQNADGGNSLSLLAERLFATRIWGLNCITGGGGCGVAWNTLLLALLTATGATSLGLAFALIVTRTGFVYKKFLRVLTILPIITPPFVIGLGLILIFGRSGLVNQFLERVFEVEPSRWIYGLQGVLLAQVFAFTPIAFLVLIGVVEGVAPSMEEAAQTLRATSWRTFVDISLPLMRPGIVNAFLVAFIESIADFGNPILLGGNFGVLSTEVFFSIVGAQLDYGRAAALALVLLSFALGAFFLQRRILGKKVYTSMSGKGESGLPALLPKRVRNLAFSIALPWTALTMVVYAMAIVGGFVETWGRNYTPTLRHYIKAFSIDIGPHGIVWSGAAWNSFWTTLQLASIAAPLTAAVGILTAYLLTRQRFAGRGLFEFGTMLSFAVPGTVIGVSYIFAFNVPPVELTGTALILVLCFVFRNMPVGVRAGIAAMSQLDKSLDEASVTLGASGFRTLRLVILPLLRPAVIASLVYSFVRAVTTVSAIIFLVSADHEMATVYIINRVINGDYGVAIAYCSVLIVLMLLAIGLIRLLVGERRIGRRKTVPVTAAAAVASV
ncbi:MAG: iron ABC transporter permease [Gammaproteobacteria bacterium]|nr:iron ABC transporter permease [Gammaproteobacteria bacterium]